MDAPDLGDPTAEAEQLKISKKTGGNGGQQNALDGFANQSRAKKSGSVSPKRELSSAPSASLRTDLLSEIEGLGSADDAALWVQRRLAAKNQLSVADAQQVEKAFAAKLRLVQAQSAETSDISTALGGQGLAEKTGETAQIDKLVFPEPRRLRDRDHIRHVIKQPCLICGRRPADPHHLRFAQSRALGRKVSDEFTVPVCRTHHREIHRSGDEESWWQNNETDPLAVARTLWLETHPLSRPEPTAASSEAKPNSPTNDSRAKAVGPMAHKSQGKTGRVGREQ